MSTIILLGYLVVATFFYLRFTTIKQDDVPSHIGNLANFILATIWPITLLLVYLHSRRKRKDEQRKSD